MADPAISPLHRSVSGTKLIDTLADSLTAIKSEDGLTDAELGKYLHKGPDAGKAYRTGFGEMPVTAFLRGCERWNGRFANDVLALIGMKLIPTHAVPMSVQTIQARLAKLMMELSLALEDGALSEMERAGMKRTLADAIEGLDSLRGAA
jgi:hypothetical protein